jgi:hypothetical protein
VWKQRQQGSKTSSARGLKFGYIREENPACCKEQLIIDFNKKKFQFARFLFALR